MASALDYCPPALGGCNPALPDMSAAACFDPNTDEIDTVLIAEPDSPGFTQDQWDDAEDLATALAARLGQTGTKTASGYTGNAAIRKWDVYDAQKPRVDRQTVKAKGMEFPKKTPFSIEGTDYDASISNHNWHDSMNCKRRVKIWYTSGGYLYGGKDGMVVAFTSSHGIVTGNDTPSEGHAWKLTWEARRTESKTVRPAIL